MKGYSGNELAKQVAEKNHSVRENGSYHEVEEKGARVYIPKTDRPLLKPVRTSILKQLARLGITLGVLAWAIAYMVSQF